MFGDILVDVVKGVAISLAFEAIKESLKEE